MKKLLPIFVVLSSMIFADQKTYPNEPAQSMRYSSLEVENTYFYMGFENVTPKIGYLKSAQLFKESLKTGKTIRELVISKKLMSNREINSLFR